MNSDRCLTIDNLFVGLRPEAPNRCRVIGPCLDIAAVLARTVGLASEVGAAARHPRAVPLADLDHHVESLQLDFVSGGEHGVEVAIALLPAAPVIVAFPACAIEGDAIGARRYRRRGPFRFELPAGKELKIATILR